MKARAPKPENLAKLSPEQRIIADKWQEEAERADVLIQGILDAIAVGNQELVSSLSEELDKLIPYYCEHGRSIFTSCLACNEIEKTLYPDAYDTDGNRVDDWYPMEKSKADLN